MSKKVLIAVVLVIELAIVGFMIYQRCDTGHQIDDIRSQNQAELQQLTTTTNERLTTANEAITALEAENKALQEQLAQSEGKSAADLLTLTTTMENRLAEANEAIATLTADRDALKQQLADAKQQTSSNLEQVNAAVGTVTTTVSALTASTDAAIAAANESIASLSASTDAAIAAVNETVASTRESVSTLSANTDAAIAAVNENVAATKESVSTLSANTDAAIAAVNENVAATKESVSTLSANTDAAIAAVNENVAATKESVSALSANTDAAIAAVNETVAATKESVSALSANTDAAIAAVNENVAATKESVSTLSANTDAAIAVVNDSVAAAQASITALSVSTDAAIGALQTNTNTLQEQVTAVSDKVISYEAIIDVEIGDTITFGKYEQDGSAANGKEEIEWMVLDAREGNVLLLSRYALDCKPYHENNTAVTWEECSLRAWLNGEFMAEAFSEMERNMIVATNNTAAGNSTYGSISGADTVDRLFLPTIQDIKQYLRANEPRCCFPTAYAVRQGAEIYDKRGLNNVCRWWLRNPGRHNLYATRVEEDGYIEDAGNYVYLTNTAVRPAMWVRMDESK